MAASIFLALGIGIFIGFTLDGQEIFVEQQQGLISELEQRFIDLKREGIYIESIVHTKEKELQRYRYLAERLLDTLIENSLSGMRVAIIQLCDVVSDNPMTELLVHAGADITSVTYLKTNNIPSYLEKVIEAGEPIEECTVTKNLVRAILTGGNEEFVKDLKGYGVIDVNGEYNEWTNFIILYQGYEKDDRTPELEHERIASFIETIKGYNIPLAGTEKADCEMSYIKAYADADIPSIDNIDDVIGQYSLVKVLQGYRGHFGIKGTANSLIPGNNEGM